GMGKSLIFLSQSLRLALTEGAATLLVYPLRALLNDQDQHIRQLFQRLGVGAAVLCGQTGLDERHRVLAEFGAGRLSVLLTTPEYLLLHAAELAARRQVRFIAIDEAHHIATEALAHRPAYRGLAQLRQSFGQAQILACTATADDAACARITADLGLDALVIDRGRRPNLSVIDQRQTPDKPAALAALADGREPCLVYVDSRDAARQLCRNLRKDLGGEAATLTGFYHAGLSAPERLDIERRFRSGALSLLFSTSAFGEGIDIPGLRHVAFSTMPLSATAYAQMAGRAGRDGAPAFIHLLFNNADTARARQLLSAQAPERGDLELLYRYLKAVERASGQIGLDDAALAAGCRSAEPESLLDARQVAAGLNVFAELGLVAVSYEYPRRQIQLIPGRQAELESSCLYLEASEALLGFDRFAAWMLEADVHELEDFIQGPLLPTHFEAGFKS
ncbi:MAG: DEAD/DEAH box helicase, partial [Coriobacteriia bacterium]|nr:DEAD/DEAH box helicase [Coriobacteriia bacterium]